MNAPPGDGVHATADWDLALCVLTLRRPIGLARLLAHIGDLAVPSSWRVGLVVVDNDADGSARPVVEQGASALGMPVRYVVEASRGISQARNRAVYESGDTPWIAFVDDDDWPEPDWLERLLVTQAETGADVVVGPTTPVFEVAPPAWVVEGAFFETPRHRHATTIPYTAARTGGVLLRRTALANFGDRPFAASLGLVGGEDSALFRRLEMDGARIVWDDHAVVHEVIPPEKTRARWIVARGFRIGMARSTTLTEVEHGGWARRLKRLGAAAYKVVVGMGALVVARGRARRVWAMRTVAHGLGLAAGAVGIRYEEYRTIRGR